MQFLKRWYVIKKKSDYENVYCVVLFKEKYYVNLIFLYFKIIFSNINSWVFQLQIQKVIHFFNQNESKHSLDDFLLIFENWLS